MPSMNIMQTLQAVQAATAKAREATAMQGIGTRVNAGRFQVVNTTFNSRGIANIDELSDWLSWNAAVEVLEQIAADKACRT